MQTKQWLKEILDSPEQPMVLSLRRYHPGVTMPSVPIPKVPATEFLSKSNLNSLPTARIKVFDLDNEVVLVATIDKQEDKNDE